MLLRSHSCTGEVQHRQGQAGHIQQQTQAVSGMPHHGLHLAAGAVRGFTLLAAGAKFETDGDRPGTLRRLHRLE